MPRVSDDEDDKVRTVALLNGDGKPFRSKSTPAAEVKASHRRIVAAPVAEVNSEAIAVLKICDAYLAPVKAEGQRGFTSAG